MSVEHQQQIAMQLRAQLLDYDFNRKGMDELFTMYAALASTKGISTTNRDVHNVWMIWAHRYDPSNPDIVPFDQLDQATKDEDSPFARAIHIVAEANPQP